MFSAANNFLRSPCIGRQSWYSTGTFWAHHCLFSLSVNSHQAVKGWSSVLPGFLYKSQDGVGLSTSPLLFALISCKREKTVLCYSFCSSYLSPHTSGLECLQSLLYMTSAVYTYHYNSRKILISFLAATRKCLTPSTAQEGPAFLSSHLPVHENQMFEAWEIFRMKTPRQQKEGVWETIVWMRESRGSWLYIKTHKILQVICLRLGSHFGRQNSIIKFFQTLFINIKMKYEKHFLLNPGSEQFL